MTYTGTEGPDVYTGTPGNDVIKGFGGNDELHGGDGDDLIEGDDGDDMLYGDGGNDTLQGGIGNDVMFGGDGNDTLVDEEGNDTLNGEAGNDTVIIYLQSGFSALDHVSGGTGIDTLQVLDFAASMDFDQLNIADDFERLNASFVTIVITTERLSHFQWIDVDGVRLTTAGSVTLGASSAASVFTLSDFGNSLDLSAGSSAHLVIGGAGNDIIHGGSGADDLSGGRGMDLIDGGAGNDILHVQNGEVSAAGDHYIGGSGVDTLFIDLPDNNGITDISAAVIDSDIENLDGANVRGTRAQIAGFATIANHEVYIADGGALDLTGKSFAGNLYLSDAGNQVTLSKTATYGQVKGGSGADTIIGGNYGTIYRSVGGDDHVYGGSGADSFYDGAGNDVYDGGGGSDTFFITAQTTAGDQFIGGAGIDFVQFLGTPIDLSTFNIGADIEGIAGTDLHLTVAQANRFTTIKSDVLSLTSAGTVTLHDDSFVGRTVNLSDAGNGIDLSGGGRSYTVNGGAGADTIIGDFAGNFLNGGGGDDVIVGGAGYDHIDGGSGTDRLSGGGGNDTYTVDSQADVVIESAGQGYDTVQSTGPGYYLGANIEALALMTEAGDAFGVGNELDNLINGNIGSNQLSGGAGADLIYGNDGADSLFGEDGNDRLLGGAGNDSIDSGAGNDVLNGQTGNDVLFGGSGADIFVFESGTGRDLIRDFETGIDKIDLTGLGFTSFADVQAHMLQNKHATVIDLGHGDTLVVQGVFNAEFSQGDFII